MIQKRKRVPNETIQDTVANFPRQLPQQVRREGAYNSSSFASTEIGQIPDSKETPASVSKASVQVCYYTIQSMALPNSSSDDCPLHCLWLCEPEQQEILG